ncbi:MAG: hypothetical protein Q7U77_11295 [Sediminibacterium sp.]|uniref:hypothetical protein n=1 Tax=Sediminibacterium sp. TaxID=1917865 RepID=UPI00271C2DAC|nr:hypothetical protein [Sediminibacterium sp.]MDO8997203.1 hypothetical protein [Sediminibacterium sp.]
MHKITPQILKKLEATEAMLPIIVSNTQEKHRMTGKEVLELGTITQIDGKDIIPEKVYIMRFPVQLYHNHKRRLRKAYQKDAYKGVEAYVHSVHQITQENQN